MHWISLKFFFSYQIHFFFWMVSYSGCLIDFFFSFCLIIWRHEMISRWRLNDAAYVLYFGNIWVFNNRWRLNNAAYVLSFGNIWVLRFIIWSHLKIREEICSSQLSKFNFFYQEFFFSLIQNFFLNFFLFVRPMEGWRVISLGSAYIDCLSYLEIDFSGEI